MIGVLGIYNVRPTGVNVKNMVDCNSKWHNTIVVYVVIYIYIYIKLNNAISMLFFSNNLLK
jgi:hypothetical protein